MDTNQLSSSHAAAPSAGIPVNKPLYQLRHLIAVLERREAERKRRHTSGDDDGYRESLQS